MTDKAVPSSSSVAFTFSKEFQESMLALMLIDPSFAEKVVKVIPDDRLYSDSHKYLYNAIGESIEKHQRPPTYLEIEDGSKKIELTKRKLILRFVKQIFSTKVTDADFIKERVTEYARKNMFVFVFQNAQTLWNTGKFDDAYSIVKDGIGDLYGVSLKDDANVSISEFENIRGLYATEISTSKRKVPTIIPPLDNILKGGLEKGELGIILAEAKKGKCASKSLNLQKSDGSTITLGEVVSTKEKDILSYNFETKKFEADEAIDWIESGVKDIYEVQTINTILKTTLNHPYLTLDGWKPLSELAPKDLVAIPRVIKVGEEDSLSPERITLIAYMLSDGTMNTGWEFTKRKEEDVMSEFISCHNSEFPEKIQTDKCKKSGRFLPSKEMKEWFGELGLLGSLAGDKFIPAIIERQNNRNVALFLNKLFTCDGSAEANNKVSFSSRSFRMITQVQSLLLRFGIHTSIKIKVVKDIKYYEIGIQSTNANTFKEQIGMSYSKGEKLTATPTSKREYCVGYPKELWSLIKKSYSDLGIKMPDGLRASCSKRSNLSRVMLEDINKTLKNKVIQSLLDEEIIFTKIKRIDWMGQEMTYDIEVKKNHNFIGNNVVLHNSQSLVHFGVAGLFHGFKVAHFVLEGMTQQSVLRYQARLSMIDYNRLESDSITKEEAFRLKRISAKHKENLILVPFNQHWNYTVMDVEAKIRELERQGNKPDLVIIDYADLLRHHEKTKEKRFEQTEVYRDLKRVAMMRNVAIWTASQARRPEDGPEKEYLLRAKDISESYEKVRIADFIATLNQTPREKEFGIVRFHADIYRSNDTDKTIRLVTDFAKSMLYSPKYGIVETTPEWAKRSKK